MVKKAKAKRKAWKKADIDDVEEALEEEKLVDKIKKRASKGKASQGTEVFSIDTKGSGAGTTREQRKKLARARIFPAKPERLGLSGMQEALVERAEKALEQAANAKPPAPAKPEVFDLWAPPPTKDPELEEFRLRKVEREVPRPAIGKKVEAPAVVPAHEGQSVNPLGSSYEELACQAAARHLEVEREAEETSRVMQPMSNVLRDALGKDAVEAMDDEAKVEAYRRIVCAGAASGGPGAEAEGAERFAGRPVKNKQKSQATRNREQTRKKLAAEERRKLAQRKLDKSVGEVGSILKEMKREEEMLRERRQHRLAKRAQAEELVKKGALPVRRKMDRTRYSEETLLVPDEEAGSGGLRKMPLQSCVLTDRVASIRRRGIIPNLPATTRGARMGKTEKYKKRKLKKRSSPMVDAHMGMASSF